MCHFFQFRQWALITSFLKSFITCWPKTASALNQGQVYFVVQIFWFSAGTSFLVKMFKMLESNIFLGCKLNYLSIAYQSKGTEAIYSAIEFHWATTIFVMQWPIWSYRNAEKHFLYIYRSLISAFVFALIAISNDDCDDASNGKFTRNICNHFRISECIGNEMECLLFACALSKYVEFRPTVWIWTVCVCVLARYFLSHFSISHTCMLM